MDRSEKLALFLGMLSGDGCLPIKHNGDGYRDYAVDFCNTNKELVLFFNHLFYGIFNVQGKIYSYRRVNRKEMWKFLKYSRKIVEELKALGFPEGVKRDVLRVPNIISTGTRKGKLSFLYGVLITDGSLKKGRGIMFHLGSKLFIQDLADLIYDLLGVRKLIKEFIQKEKYYSYQLSLNKQERLTLLSEMPTWDNGTPTVLS